MVSMAGFLVAGYAMQSEFLKLTGHNVIVFTSLVAAGVFVFVTGLLAWAAAHSNSKGMAMSVSSSS
jgi:hypothetical protein